MPQEGYDKYLQNLRSDATQNALRNKQMPTPLLADCVESGIVDVHDETLLFEIEKSVGRRLKPAVEPTMNIGNAQNQTKAPSTRACSTKGMPVVKTGDKPPLFAQDKPVPADIMYRQVIADTDARLASDPILQHKALSPSILYNARRDWCTPDLMRALVLDPTFVFRLRAAMYPYLVSYYTRTFPIDGKTYLVPYITIFNGSKEDGTTVLSKDRFSYDEKDGKGVYDTYGTGNRFEARTTTFYLNRYGKIGMMKGIIKHMYAPSDFSSPEAVRRYMGQLREAYNAKIKSVHAPDAKKQYKQDLKDIEGFLEPYASGREPISSPQTLMSKFMKFHRLMTGGDTGDTFTNIKTGESGYSVTRNDRKESRMDGNGWERVIDITPCVKNNEVKHDLICYLFERQSPGSVERIKAAGLESLRRLHDKMLSTDRCTKTDRGTYADLDGEDEFYDYFRD